MKKLLLFVLIFFMSGTSYLLAQSAVTGKVTDENGDGIPGANIIIKGTRTGSVTDFDGNYSFMLSLTGTDGRTWYPGGGLIEIKNGM